MKNTEVKKEAGFGLLARANKIRDRDIAMKLRVAGREFIEEAREEENKGHCVSRNLYWDEDDVPEYEGQVVFKGDFDEDKE